MSVDTTRSERTPTSKLNSDFWKYWGRVISIASVLAWSAIPLGSLVGGLAIEWTKNVALVYAVAGVLSFLIPFAFSFTALGHAARYLPQQEAKDSGHT